jgi:hypothetical protein
MYPAIPYTVGVDNNYSLNLAKYGGIEEETVSLVRNKLQTKTEDPLSTSTKGSSSKESSKNLFKDMRPHNLTCVAKHWNDTMKYCTTRLPSFQFNPDQNTIEISKPIPLYNLLTNAIPTNDAQNQTNLENTFLTKLQSIPRERNCDEENEFLDAYQDKYPVLADLEPLYGWEELIKDYQDQYDGAYRQYMIYKLAEKMKKESKKKATTPTGKRKGKRKATELTNEVVVEEEKKHCIPIIPPPVPVSFHHPAAWGIGSRIEKDDLSAEKHHKMFEYIHPACFSTTIVPAHPTLSLSRPTPPTVPADSTTASSTSSTSSTPSSMYLSEIDLQILQYQEELLDFEVSNFASLTSVYQLSDQYKVISEMQQTNHRLQELVGECAEYILSRACQRDIYRHVRFRRPILPHFPSFKKQMMAISSSSTPTPATTITQIMIDDTSTKFTPSATPKANPSPSHSTSTKIKISSLQDPNTANAPTEGKSEPNRLTKQAKIPVKVGSSKDSTVSPSIVIPNGGSPIDTEPGSSGRLAFSCLCC